MGEKKYQGETWTGRKYWEDENGNREYEGETFFGTKYREDKDGNRTYEGETIFGTKYREDHKGNREYEGETFFGTKYWEDKDGNRTYEGETLFGTKYEEKNSGFRKSAESKGLSVGGGYSGSSSTESLSGFGLLVFIVICIFVVIWLISNPASTPTQQNTPAQQQNMPSNPEMSEAEKRDAVANRIVRNQRSGLVSSILMNGTFSLNGRVSYVSWPPSGSGSYWSFEFTTKNDLVPYWFMCSNYDELYFRIGDNDVDWSTGTDALLTQSNNITLYFPTQQFDFIQRCSLGHRCDGSVCPLGIVINE